MKETSREKEARFFLKMKEVLAKGKEVSKSCLA